MTTSRYPIHEGQLGLRLCASSGWTDWWQIIFSSLHVSGRTVLIRWSRAQRKRAHVRTRHHGLFSRSRPLMILLASAAQLSFCILHIVVLTFWHSAREVCHSLLSKHEHAGYRMKVPALGRIFQGRVCRPHAGIFALVLWLMSTQLSNADDFTHLCTLWLSQGHCKARSRSLTAWTNGY